MFLCIYSHLLVWCKTCLLIICLQDVIAGLSLAALLMVFIIPALEYIDDFQLKHEYAPYVMILVTIGAAFMYPRIDEWSTCRGDTMLILGTLCHLADAIFLIPQLIPISCIITLSKPLSVAHSNWVDSCTIMISRLVHMMNFAPLDSVLIHLVEGTDNLLLALSLKMLNSVKYLPLSCFTKGLLI